MGLWPWSRRGRGGRVLLSAGELRSRLDEETSRAERGSLPLSVIFCEVAKVRGLLGGSAPFEQFLGEFCGLLQSGLRRVDVKGWGDGRRVAVLMPNTAEAGARVVLERLSGWVAAYFRRERIAVEAGGLFELAVYPDFVRLQAAAGGPGQGGRPAVAPSLAGGPSLCGMSRALKRAFDLVGALLLILLSAPLMLLVALAARLSSPGPAIFRQVRLGEGGRPFVYYKFRSMYVANDDTAHRDYTRRLIQGEVADINNGNGGALLLKLAADPRITPVGRLLRRASLDELPQLFNVLKGDMSLVGPRPPIPYEVGHYRGWHLRRVLAAKPGLTGLWQVRSRSSSSFDDMVRMDLRYADTWSLWADLLILAQTIPAVLSTRGAY